MEISVTRQSNLYKYTRNQEMNKLEREQITIRLPAELKERLQQEAKEIGIAFNAYIFMTLNEAKNRQD